MAIEVFSRYEKKYIINRENLMWLLEKIEPYMNPDKYNKNGKLYNIANIYFDTRNDALIRASIEKPVYKEKLRLRSYGVPNLEDEVYLEIKKKYKGLVNKRRTRLHLKEAYDLVEKGINPVDKSYINAQVLNEIQYFLNIYDLSPKVYLTYDRMAFFDKINGDFRVTFDTNIRTRRDDVRLEAGNHGRLLLDDDTWLMEVKSSGAVPLWFAALLSEKEIYTSSFSKYGTEYKKTLINNKGELLCSNQFFQVQQRLQQYQPKGQLFA